MGIELNAIFSRLNDYFGKQVVVSEDEIKVAVAGEVDKLDTQTRKKLEDQLQGDLKEVLVSSIVSAPISVYSPNLTSKRNYLGETFYHYPTHEFLAEELEKAFKRMTMIRSVDKLDVLHKVASALLIKSGYEVISSNCQKNPLGCRELTATKTDRKLVVFVLPSLNFAVDYAEGMDENQEYVIVVPIERTPAPFIQFCREKAEEFSGKKIQIWVVDHEKETVNPFLGYTHDDDLYRNFENAPLAARACRLYGVGKDLWVRSS